MFDTLFTEMSEISRYQNSIENTRKHIYQNYFFSKFWKTARSVNRIGQGQADKREKPSKVVQFANELAEILSIANFENRPENT